MLPTAGLNGSLGVALGVIGPSLAQGVIIRRPRMVALVERLDLERRAIRRMQALRRRHDGPLLIGPVGGRRWALLLTPDDVRRVLDETPEPFATSTLEKRAALSQFQPKGALISQGSERADRRRFNETVLQIDAPVHGLADRFLAVVAEEAQRLIASDRVELGWKAFSTSWFRIVRRVVFGDAARDDVAITALVDRLRSYANWALLLRPRRHLRDEFFARLNEHLSRAEPGSLASVMTAVPKSRQTAPDHQVPQWLFAFDPAGMTTFRTLALLAAHPDRMLHALDELRTHDLRDLPFLRACVLESLRLWPTAPLILRETTIETAWRNESMPPHTGVIIFTPYFHRDEERLAYANLFAPDIWLADRSPEHSAIVPFSGGPARCPGRQLVLLLTSAMVATLISHRDLRAASPSRLDRQRPMPATLNHFTLRFQLTRQ